MPRLLLVDDNPSIHRIAESLLAPTDVELVCVDSAAEALDRIGRGERFDVALVDTAMPGMDGWTLLSRLRAMPETASMPIALMAGVLDPVDPAKLAKAPVQGFLKKPIELRELGDRVKTLLATPVTPPSPFSTVPATPARDLIQRAEAALPEYRPESVAPPPAPEPAPAQVVEALPEPEEDLLVLTAEDLWPEEAPAVAPLPEVHLELEELDLESLQDLAVEPPPATPPAAAEPLSLEPAFADDGLVTLSGLEELDLGPLAETGSAASEAGHAPAGEVPAHPLPELEPIERAIAPLGDLPPGFPGAEAAHAAPGDRPTASGPEVSALVAEVLSSLDLPLAPRPVHGLEAAAGGQPPAASGQALVPAVPPAAPPAPAAVPALGAPLGDGQAQAVVQAILADPVLVDALVKTIVARMGDQAIREIAWEVMPDLAGRLHQ